MITELINQYEKILEKPKSDDRFYHIKSVANFINNFSQLKSPFEFLKDSMFNAAFILPNAYFLCILRT